MSMSPKTPRYERIPRLLRRVRKLASGKLWVGYYYNGRENGKRKEIPLGTDLAEAKRKWVELECRPQEQIGITFGFVLSRYERDILPSKAPATQRVEKCAIKKLNDVLSDVDIDELTPQMIARYRDGRSAKVGANRELSIASHAFNLAREWGYTSKENPVRGVRKNKETPRKFYTDDDVYYAVYECGCDVLKDAMDLIYLAGQRPADALKMSRHDLKGNALEVTQNKTGTTLRILLEFFDKDGKLIRTELGQVIDRITRRKVTGIYLVSTPSGKRLTMGMLHRRFISAKTEAAARAEDENLRERILRFQIRDLRAKAASDIDSLKDASDLLGHTTEAMTKKVYRRRGKLVKPTR